MDRRVLIGIVAALVGSAHGHVGDLFGGMDVLLPGPGPTTAIDASFGLLWSEDGARYTFICHEAILGPDGYGAPAYSANEDAVRLGAVPSLAMSREAGEPVYRSTDGCTWDVAAGLTDERVVGLSFDPTDPDVVVAATGDVTESATNRILHSTDAGATWSAAGPELEDGFYRGITISNVGSRWATSLRADQTHATIHHSADGGSWTDTSMELPVLEDERVVLLDLVAASPTDPDTAWFVRGPIGGPDQLLLTTDGGVTTEVVYEARDDIADGVVTDSGHLWLVLSTADVVVARDGRTVVAAPAATPDGSGIDARGDEILLVTKDALIDGTLAVSTDGGETWDEELVLDLIEGPIDCPPETHGAQCAALWEDTLERLVEPRDTGDTGDPDTDDTDGEPGGCGGCSGLAAPGGALLLAVFALGIVRRRRA